MAKLHTPVQYLQVIGRLYPDNRLELRPSYLTHRPPRVPPAEHSPLEAQLLDASGAVILRHWVWTALYSGSRDVLAVRAAIPFAPATKTVRFLRDTVVVHEVKVLEDKAALQISWKPTATVRGRKTITWSARHPGGAPLEFLLRYSHSNGTVWQRVGRRTTATSHTIDFDSLPGGKKCKIAVVATDGINTTIAETKAFEVGVKRYRAFILSSLDGETIPEGASIRIQGQGFVLEELRAETEQLAWASSRDGALGKGMFLDLSVLSAGKHTVTLHAGPDDRRGEASIDIRVKPRPRER